MQVQTGAYSVHIENAENGYDCPLTLTAGDGANEFLLDGLFQFEGLAFIGVYDPVELTITFDGTIQGQEADGPIWGYGITYTDDTQSEMLALLSQQSTAPCIVSVNEDGTLKAFTTSLQLIGFSTSDGSLTGLYEQITADTPITKSEAGTTARTTARRAQLSTVLRASL